MERQGIGEKKISKKTIDDIIAIIEQEKSGTLNERLGRILIPLSDQDFTFVSEEVFKALEPKRDAVKLARTLIELRDQKRDVVENKEAEQRNFSIEISGEGSSVSLVLRSTETGDTFDLSALLPPGYLFNDSGEYRCDFGNKVVSFNSRDVSKRFFIPALLHEIGHTHQSGIDKYQLRQPSVVEAMRMHVRIFLYLLSRSSTSRAREGIRASIPLMNLSVNVPEDVLPLPFLKESEDVMVRGERDAWAYSLQTLRKLKEQGYDALRDFSSSSEIQDLVHYFLLNHDISRLEQDIQRSGAHEAIARDLSYSKKRLES